MRDDSDLGPGGARRSWRRAFGFGASSRRRRAGPPPLDKPLVIIGARDLEDEAPVEAEGAPAEVEGAPERDAAPAGGAMDASTPRLTLDALLSGDAPQNGAPWTLRAALGAPRGRDGALRAPESRSGRAAPLEDVVAYLSSLESRRSPDTNPPLGRRTPTPEPGALILQRIAGMARLIAETRRKRSGPTTS